MLRKGTTRTLIFLVSICLLPRAAAAVEGSRNLGIGHLGDRVEAYVDLSSDGARATAVPRIRIKGLQPAPPDASPDTDKDAKNPLARFLPQGSKAIEKLQETDEISYRNAVRLLRDAKELLRKRRHERDGGEKIDEGTAESANPPSFARSAAID